jgi:hypothetical protein
VYNVSTRRPSLVDALPEYGCSHLFLVLDPAISFLKSMPHILPEVETWHSRLQENIGLLNAVARRDATDFLIIEKSALNGVGSGWALRAVAADHWAGQSEGWCEVVVIVRPRTDSSSSVL